MEDNAACLCGQFATHFCICQKPTKLLLCETCVLTHLQKPGAHSFFDIRVRDLIDPDLYNLRSQAASQYRACIDHFHHLISQERISMNDTLNNIFEQSYKELQNKFQGIWTQLNTVYAELDEVLEKVKTDVRKLETELRAELMPETWKIMEVCWMGEYWRVGRVMDVREEVEKGMRNQGCTSQSVLESWGCSMTDCPTCTSKQTELGLFWPCQSCGQSTLNRNQYCYQCSFYPSYSPASPQYWTCPKCHYSNRYGEQCVQCTSDRQALSMQSLPTMTWICSCGTPQYQPKCYQCMQWKSQSVYGTESILQEQMTKWSCMECSSLNNMNRESCESCGESRWKEVASAGNQQGEGKTRSAKRGGRRWGRNRAR